MTSLAPLAAASAVAPPLSLAGATVPDVLRPLVERVRAATPSADPVRVSTDEALAMLAHPEAAVELLSASSVRVGTGNGEATNFWLWRQILDATPAGELWNPRLDAFALRRGWPDRLLVERWNAEHGTTYPATPPGERVRSLAPLVAAGDRALTARLLGYRFSCVGSMVAGATPHLDALTLDALVAGAAPGAIITLARDNPHLDTAVAAGIWVRIAAALDDPEAATLVINRNAEHGHPWLQWRSVGQSLLKRGFAPPPDVQARLREWAATPPAPRQRSWERPTHRGDIAATLLLSPLVSLTPGEVAALVHAGQGAERVEPETLALVLMHPASTPTDRAWVIRAAAHVDLKEQRRLARLALTHPALAAERALVDFAIATSNTAELRDLVLRADIGAADRQRAFSRLLETGYRLVPRLLELLPPDLAAQLPRTLLAPHLAASDDREWRLQVGLLASRLPAPTTQGRTP